VPAFAVGTNYIPQDMLARVHKGEAIVPAAFNPAAGGVGGSNMARLEALVERQGRQLEAMSHELRAIATSTNKTYKSLDAVIHGEDSINTAPIA
jgi:hypothetical protein